ncbi:type II toxin-antitoxin system Phd/YefM family antitoxin [Cryobacterium sp. Y11]|uniref:type II toxin-antitoxin system Phd/YefM family antitoxin n=1 Tax=Cryobacterium sp. Y11 TaxID=2045016 RepID=UPI000CE2D1C1|nr:type II toxin-antitoxin system Phd/YefM family antitoxin [Cryobacterium sp. Y11]
MSTIIPVTVSVPREQLASIIDQVCSEHEPVFLSRRGRRVATIIDADDLERLIELAEDTADIRAAEESREEIRHTENEPTPGDQMQADLGLA